MFQWSAEGGLQTSLKLLIRKNMWRPALVELHNFDKNKCEIPLASGALEPDLRF